MRASALLALRLSSEREPLLRSHPKALDLLEIAASSDSLLAVASELGLHHSTVQRRVADYGSALGFDLRAAAGRVRLALALSLYRLATNRFE